MNQEPFDFSIQDLNPKFLFSCLVERNTEEKNYHSHDFIELAIIMKGSSLFCINGINYTVSTGDLILLNPGTLHKSVPVITPNSTCCLECYMGFAEIEYRDCIKNTLPLFHGQNQILHMNDKLKHDVFQLCLAVHKEIKSALPGRYFMIKSYLIQMLCLLYREQQTAPKPGRGYVFQSTNKEYIVNEIIRYMEEHYREKISLEQIAENMYLSTFYISKLFKSETGDTPINYLIQLRLEKAKEILDTHPEQSIQQISASVGYDDAYHFSKLFKKHYGISPLYYRSSKD